MPTKPLQLGSYRAGQEAQAAELADRVLSQHGQTVYEGDPSVPPDMDDIMATIASAIGIKPVRLSIVFEPSSRLG